jgi:hypothetical protein
MKGMIKKITQFLVASLLLISVGYSESNGIWHKAEDIRPGIFGSDESTSGFIFQSSLSIQNSISATTLFDYDDNTYFLNPNGNSKLNNLDLTTISINGIVLDNIYVNENQGNSISSAMIIDNTISANDLGVDSVGASELVVSYESGSAYDSRFINTGGDTMLGTLNLGNNQILGVSTIDTGFGANELYPMNQAVLTTSAPSFTTINTGLGANELYPMNQAVLTTSSVTFNNVNSNGILYVNEIRPKTGSSVTIRLN